MVKARPILFSTPMVQALLAGRKTQTRRAVKPQPVIHPPGDASMCGHRGSVDYLLKEIAPQYWCPYGKIGDLLYVREGFVWKIMWSSGAVKGRMVELNKSEPFIVYRADLAHPELTKPWKPSIHMPRKDSRLTLEIKDIRVERLQDCSEADATAEGSEPGRPYGTIWKQINGEESWNSNPWVWVIEFKVHKCNVDEFMKGKAA